MREKINKHTVRFRGKLGQDCALQLSLALAKRLIRRHVIAQGDELLLLLFKWLLSHSKLLFFSFLIGGRYRDRLSGWRQRSSSPSQPRRRRRFGHSRKWRVFTIVYVGQTLRAHTNYYVRYIFFPRCKRNITKAGHDCSLILWVQRERGKKLRGSKTNCFLATGLEYGHLFCCWVYESRTWWNSFKRENLPVREVQLFNS